MAHRALMMLLVLAALGAAKPSPTAKPKPTGPLAAAPPAAATARPLIASRADVAPHQFNPAAAKHLLTQGIEKLIFVRRFTLTANHVYTEHVNSRWTPGGGLCILDLKTGAVTDLLPELSGGVFNRFDLSFDASRIIFDYKKSALEGYRIYEVDIDGQNLRQLTFPPADEPDLIRQFARAGYHHGTDDMHPCYLPGGDIVFTSTRCQSSVLCDSSDGFTTTILHRMNPDGSNIHRLSHNAVSEFSPAVMSDGRLLYMRWEYNRKGAGAVKCLWSMLPDGSGSAEVYGNVIIDPETMIYGRPIPSTTDKLVFLGASHWGPNNAMGTVIVLDMNADNRTREAMKFITKDVDTRAHDGFDFLVNGAWVHDKTGTPGRLFKDPYPISESLFLAAHKPAGLTWNDPRAYDLCVLDADGRDTLLYRDEEISCWHPYPLRARPVPPIPAAAPAQPDLAAKGLAQCMVADIYAGLNGVPRGQVKFLRILEQTPRPWAARNRWKGDQASLAHSTMGYGILGMQAQHGIVPVEEDGSANFLVPAGRNIYYQALDENYMAIQTERTYINYIPGERRSCVGCHNHAGSASSDAAGRASKAMARAPSLPAAQPGDSSPKKLFDYARQIQPIWNQHCIECHNAAPKVQTTLDLTADPTALYSKSYEALLGIGADKAKRPRHPLVGGQVDENDVRAFVEYTPPYFFGARSSLLAATFGQFEPTFERFGPAAAAMTARLPKLRQDHKDIKLSRDEWIRIVNWLDASCQFYNSYWGMKNLSHKDSPWFRPEVTFEEALGIKWPERMKGIYEVGVK